MAIIGFWSGSRKETGQTVSIAAIATHMAVEHNYRILLIDATFNDDTLERCFWTVSNKKDFAHRCSKRYRKQPLFLRQSFGRKHYFRLWHSADRS